MAEERFREPDITLNRIYTRTGDDGRSNLVGGQRVDKDDLRLECFGTVDELNSCVGLARVSAEADAALAPLVPILHRVQHELFNLGSLLATLPQDVGPQQPRVTAADVERLEREIDTATERLPELHSFVLPGGTRCNAELHLARTVCRRAERIAVKLQREGGCGPEAVQYLNRLSDALFVWSRLVNMLTGMPEVLWDPNVAK